MGTRGLGKKILQINLNQRGKKENETNFYDKHCGLIIGRAEGLVGLQTVGLIKALLRTLDFVSVET